jgi:hypothetical protein
VVVADLGTAKRDPRNSTILTRTGALVGTLSYLAPEQFLPGGSRRSDVRTDVYQLGKVLFQLLTGRPPALIETSALPAGLASVVERATASHPDDRYPDVASLLEALDACDETARQPRDPRGQLEDLVSSRHRPRSRPRSESGSSSGSGSLMGRTLSPTLDEMTQAIDLLRQVDPTRTADTLGSFDLLPEPWLAAMAEERPSEFLVILDAYRRAVIACAARQDFHYADHVSRRMRAVVLATTDPEIKARSLEILLIVAVALNRYAAMTTFRKLLLEIRGERAALAVAEMLRAHLDEFQEVARNLNEDRLHPAIRGVLADLTWIDTVAF